jgi:hypothetical protein
MEALLVRARRSKRGTDPVMATLIVASALASPALVAVLAVWVFTVTAAVSAKTATPLVMSNRSRRVGASLLGARHEGGPPTLQHRILAAVEPRASQVSR